MSKFVKDMLTKDLVSRLDGVEDCVVANVALDCVKKVSA